MNKCNKSNAPLGVVRSRLVGAECARQVSCIFCFPFYPDDFWFGRIGPGRHLALEIGAGFRQVDGRSLGCRCTLLYRRHSFDLDDAASCRRPLAPYKTPVSIIRPAQAT